METKIQVTNKLETFLNNAEFNRFGLISVVLTIVACLGGIAIGMGAITNTFAMILVTIPTMATLSLLLSVSPMNWIFKAGIASLIVDIAVILYYVI